MGVQVHRSGPACSKRQSRSWILQATAPATLRPLNTEHDIRQPEGGVVQKVEDREGREQTAAQCVDAVRSQQALLMALSVRLAEQAAVTLGQNPMAR